MTQGPKSPSQQARSARLSQALRENLKRRKAQMRGRSAEKKSDKLQNPANRHSDR